MEMYTVYMNIHKYTISNPVPNSLVQLSNRTSVMVVTNNPRGTGSKIYRSANRRCVWLSFKVDSNAVPMDIHYVFGVQQTNITSGNDKRPYRYLKWKIQKKFKS